MLKIFTTQLNGVFQKIVNQEEVFEDASRFLAQAIIGEGTVYIHGTKEFVGIVSEITEGAEQSDSIKPLFSNGEIQSLSPVDRVLLFTRQTNDQEAIDIAKKLTELNIGLVIVSTTINHEDQLSDLADVFINYELTRKLVPTDEGDRIGFPTLLVGLFIYHCLLLTINEIIADFD
ncbi:DUF2529 family protein [Gottfriedia luciferensis]|uniref:DUF2529 family protein n=1 Tax=Gottfriedia luciferensis TaxID=178774 RepID=UPI000B454ACE|nr:DUF2529 family protein [Gottfriedia luciferensis]